jgi:hypothetical protein
MIAAFLVGWAQEPAASAEDPIAAISASTPSTSDLDGLSTTAKFDRLARCVPVAEFHYCLLSGYVSPDVDVQQVRQDGMAAAQRSTTDSSGSGARSMIDLLQERARMSDLHRNDVEVAEITEAVAGLDKARLIEQLRQGNFPAPIARKGAGPDTLRFSAVQPLACDPSPCGTPPSYSMMTGYNTEQVASNYCGPATMQMFDWAGDGTLNTQSFIANNWLGTTSSGTGLAEMVSATNNHTAWDNNAGAYIRQSTSGWSAAQFLNTHVGHIYSLNAPIIEHPILTTAYYPYLNSNHSGHFQVGRGYDTTANTIRIFEPFDERDFSAGGNATAGAHAVSAASILHSTQDNQNNFGL